MASKKVDPTLMKAGEEAFWQEFEQAEKTEERYYVIDKASGDIVVQNARLLKNKKKIKV